MRSLAWRARTSWSCPGPSAVMRVLAVVVAACLLGSHPGPAHRAQPGALHSPVLPAKERAIKSHPAYASDHDVCPHVRENLQRWPTYFRLTLPSVCVAPSPTNQHEQNGLTCSHAISRYVFE